MQGPTGIHYSLHSAENYNKFRQLYHNLCFAILRIPHPWRPRARQGTGRQNEPQGKASHSGRTWLGHPPCLHHYSCEASERNVAASNGHRWCSVTSQVMCEYLVPLLHSFKGKKSTLHCTIA